jgi:hypothetical protein
MAEMKLGAIDSRTSKSELLDLVNSKLSGVVPVAPLELLFQEPLHANSVWE